ncbi:metal ABC transporter solute-binding protein, Zn/Mn family [Sedimentibacter sp.]|uniref:metal ABC transporter solute-binding protein, Zn/Mn family n=1 Tax=Sedimentibacter sp. TaxID=1960295 RepID=UPI0028A2B661|nr:zinc ABC transporter substrate-binding protein [Sedimentibacter sp.]
MNKKISALLSTALSLALLFAGCSAPAANTDFSEDKINIVATTTMLADLSAVIGGERVNVNGLMGPGIDPHLYQASAGDVLLMQKSDVVVYNGLHLEGKMGEVFENLSGQGLTVICIEDGMDETQLLASEDDSSVHDPHIWFDVSLWKNAAKIAADGLSKADPEGKTEYQENLSSYLKELDEADTYIRNRAAELTQEQRILVTTHDAFQYFGEAYGFEVRGLQGISTDSEAGTADVSGLANFIVERQIKAIFVESSVPPKTIEALQAAVKSKGFDVVIGGELYSDSLGDVNSGASTYILTVKANIDTIVDALK